MSAHGIGLANFPGIGIGPEKIDELRKIWNSNGHPHRHCASGGLLHVHDYTHLLEDVVLVQCPKRSRMLRPIRRSN